MKAIGSCQHPIIARPRARMLIAAGAAAVVLSGAAAFAPWGPDALALTEYSTPAITLAGGNPVIAIQTSHDGLQFYRRQSGTDTWRGEPVAGNQSTYSAPSIAQDGSSVIIAAQGPDNSLDFYWELNGTTQWHPETIPGADAVSAPSITTYSDADGQDWADVVVQGPIDGLLNFVNANGSGTWLSQAVSDFPIFNAGSAPTVIGNNGTENIAAFGASGNLLFYGPDRNGVWRQQVVSRVT